MTFLAETTVDPVQRATAYGWQLYDALQRGQRRELAREQAVLIGLLRDIDDVSPDGKEPSAFRGPRYAVTCWLDELFTCRSPWSEAWNQRKLESELYGSNDRAWEFWRQARLAEAQPHDGPLAAYFLCVALGFRGQRGDSPDQLEEWMLRMQIRLSRVTPPWQSISAGYSPGDSELPTVGRAPLRGTQHFRRMVAAAGIAMLVTLPWLTYLIVNRVGR